MMNCMIKPAHAVPLASARQHPENPKGREIGRPFAGARGGGSAPRGSSDKAGSFSSHLRARRLVGPVAEEAPDAGLGRSARSHRQTQPVAPCRGVVPDRRSQRVTCSFPFECSGCMLGVSANARCTMRARARVVAIRARRSRIHGDRDLALVSSLV